MPGKISIGFGLLLLASIGQAFAAAQQDYDDCNQTSDLDRSIAACTRVVDDQAEATADRVTAYLHRGNDYIAAGKLDEAIADYGAAIGLDAKSMLAYAARAIAYWRKSDRDHAVADYRKAASMDAAGVRDMGRGNAELTTIRHAARDGACALATAHWYETTQKMATVTAYEDHLARFSVCGYAPLAQAGIAALTQSGSLQQIGNVDHARLGVLIASVTAEIALARGLNAARGALVSEPMPGGAALQAGVQKGDVIVAVDDDEVSDPGELSAMIVSAKPRASIRLTVIRAGAEKKIDAVLAAEPGAPQAAWAFCLRANASLRNRDFDGARADYDAAFAIDADPQQVLVCGSAYDVKDYDRSLADLTEAINKGVAPAYFFRANLLYSKFTTDNPDLKSFDSRFKADYSLLDRAVADYDQTIKRFPRWAYVYALRSGAKQYKGDAAGAAADLAVAKELGYKD